MCLQGEPNVDGVNGYVSDATDGMTVGPRPEIVDGPERLRLTGAARAVEFS